MGHAKFLLNSMGLTMLVFFAAMGVSQSPFFVIAVLQSQLFSRPRKSQSTNLFVLFKRDIQLS